MSAVLFHLPRSAAYLSADGKYRWWLSRRWSEGPSATFVMLNPSIADATDDDPTIRRCVKFAKTWGMAGILVVNLYALRSTDPKGLWVSDDPVGTENDDVLTMAAQDAALHGTPIVAAWGANARPDRVAQALALPGMDRLSALGVTNDGAPKHPLARGKAFMPYDTPLTPWPAPSGEAVTPVTPAGDGVHEPPPPASDLIGYPMPRPSRPAPVTPESPAGEDAGWCVTHGSTWPLAERRCEKGDPWDDGRECVAGCRPARPAVQNPTEGGTP